MKPSPPAIKIVRGYARDEKDHDRLRAAGVRTVYRADKGETFERFKLRSGEGLGVVDGLLTLGENRQAITKAIAVIHGWGAVLIDAETGKNSRDHAFEMMSDALDPAKPSAEYMRILQKKSAEKRRRNRTPRMSEREALPVWRNPKLTVKEALAIIAWPQATAYHILGKRFVVAGRRPKST